MGVKRDAALEGLLLQGGKMYEECRFIEDKQEKASCLRKHASASSMTKEELAEIGIGIVGGELLEYGIKKAIAKRAASKAASKVSKKMAEKIAKKMVSKAAAKAATKAAAKFAAKAALKAAAGPVGWALLAFDVLSFGLDLWDPLGYNEMVTKDNIKEYKSAVAHAYKNIYDNGEFETNEGMKKGHEVGITFPMRSDPDYPNFNDKKVIDKFTGYIFDYLEENGYDLSPEGEEELKEEEIEVPEGYDPNSETLLQPTTDTQNFLNKYWIPIVISVVVIVLLIIVIIVKTRS